MAFLTTFHPSALVEPAAQRVQLAPGATRWASTSRRWRAATCLRRRSRLAGSASPHCGRGPERRGMISATSQGFTSDAVGRLHSRSGRTRRVHAGRGRSRWTSPLGSLGEPARRVALDRDRDLEEVVVVTQPGSASRDASCWPTLRRRRLPSSHCVPPRRPFDVHSTDIVASIDGNCGFGPPIFRSKAGARFPDCRAAGPSRPSC